MPATTVLPPVAPVLAKAGTQIRLTDVVKDYGLAVPAVDGVSLTIEPGEFMTLLGPSGSGKTTTLNLIAGFETLTSGHISFNGDDVSTLPPHKRNLGMLFQNYALFPHMTVAQNVAYPLRERKVPKPEIARRVAEVLELVQLTGRDDNVPAQLSGGQQQRVALARAIVFGPKALLLDEPLGALDRNLRGALQAEIQRIHREVGSTFVFVTHDQEEAMSLSDRIALFNNGKIEQVGSPETLYKAPETLFTARFLGDSNVFELAQAPGSTVVWADRSWSVEPRTVSDRARAGSQAALVVRPEDVHIAVSADAVPAGVSAVPATVTDVQYLGSYRTVVLAYAGGVVGRARVDASETQLAVGEQVTAWWRVERQRVVSR
ncbi:ABC transporter ATP-binding protein [Modestobacter versicolor]|uniref:Spermidine/putrescine import ATP-binding protein PotA n=1 Tax=Modestobacter versicolor TaxID=429133 RepID=A0A323VE66_9ACTN|nr:ABC transporter ATP-binding protein [Modestobacter versicolor]MBB3674871.1 putative spermidine/putrescine transport system ATP-binding protein [Modestobacter versicolor]PZA22909.1 polyamine ABC transporter ATP-binding protein [Modestobacter versicolor]